MGGWCSSEEPTFHAVSRCVSNTCSSMGLGCCPLSLSTSHALPQPMQRFPLLQNLHMCPTTPDPSYQHDLLPGHVFSTQLQSACADQAMEKAKRGVSGADFLHEGHDSEGLCPLSSHQFWFNSSGLYVFEDFALPARCWWSYLMNLGADGCRGMRDKPQGGWQKLSWGELQVL